MTTQRYLGLIILSILPLAAQDYDLVLKGGHIIDGKNRINGVRDVAIRSGRIAAVEANIDPAKARQALNVQGLYVTPGLVDIHVHVYAGTGRKGAYDGDNSVYPDGFTFRCGVTTVVDAGSSGWRNFSDFKDRVIDRNAPRSTPVSLSGLRRPTTPARNGRRSSGLSRLAYWPTFP
jgi:dihydroorotase